MARSGSVTALKHGIWQHERSVSSVGSNNVCRVIGRIVKVFWSSQEC